MTESAMSMIVSLQIATFALVVYLWLIEIGRPEIVAASLSLLLILSSVVMIAAPALGVLYRTVRRQVGGGA